MISIKEVENIALLSRLELSEEQKPAYQSQVSNILSFIEKINELDLKNVEPTAHILDVKNVMRADLEKSSMPPEEILLNAPERKDGFIVVPKVVS